MSADLLPTMPCSLRFTALRATALPTYFGTTKPTLKCSSSSVFKVASTRKRPPNERPCLRTLRNSLLQRMLLVRGNRIPQMLQANNSHGTCKTPADDRDQPTRSRQQQWARSDTVLHGVTLVLHFCTLGNQTLTSLLATSTNDVATAAGFHPCTKAMLVLAGAF